MPHYSESRLQLFSEPRIHPRAHIFVVAASQIIHHVTELNQRPELPSDLQPEVSKLITDCWAVDPADRPNFNEVLDRLSGMQDIRASQVCVARNHA
eukprot:357138-Chlamydomonas_euryale.AAC.2